MAKARDYKRKVFSVLACKNCGVEFVPVNSVHKFCTSTCKGKWKYVSQCVTTSGQYERISGNWYKYSQRLLYSDGRKRSGLTVETILKLLEEQDYKCALTGLDLTCNLEKGKRFWTNASVDRIEAGGPYTKDNIQLVCRAVNSWRSDMPLKDFVDVCKAVASYQERLEGKDGPA